MDDTISRQAAINAAKRTDYRGLTVEDVKKVTDAVVEELKTLPSAQPEIIRCEYCAHRNQYRFPPKYEVKDYCEVHEKVTALNNFCSWADRR